MRTVAIVGQPNCGKSALFNSLTKSHQKVANYPGVTVERREGWARCPSGFTFRAVDLPGLYSLDPNTPDQQITRDVLRGKIQDLGTPDLVIAVVDATQLSRNLGVVLDLKKLGIPLLVAVNMMDLAKSRDLELDLSILERELGVKAIATVAVHGFGIRSLVTATERILQDRSVSAVPSSDQVLSRSRLNGLDTGEEYWSDFAKRQTEIDRILALAILRPVEPPRWTERLDRILLHRGLGLVILAAILLVVFQSVFNLAAIPQQWITEGCDYLSEWVTNALRPGLLCDLLVSGVIAGAGSVLVFLPQIVFLFLFILILEDCGYMARAAFLMDRVMRCIGLEGRALFPLLSSYACAVPGIMATRTLAQERDRLATILVSPLATCSARLPVYALLIGAFIPNRAVWGPVSLQGLVLFLLYLVGGVTVFVVAFLFRRVLLRGTGTRFLMDMPTYKWPSIRNISMGLLERVRIFLRRVGTVILALVLMLWFLSSFPRIPLPADAESQDPVQMTTPPIEKSYAGRIGGWLEPLLRPLGFDWRISIALVPGMAAREVMVGALATVYAVENKDHDDLEKARTVTRLQNQLQSSWSLATALSVLAWYIFAPQCLSTLAAARRETHSLKWPLVMLGYLFALAYLAAFITYRLAVYYGG